MCVVNLQVTCDLKWNKVHYRRPTNGDFHGGDGNWSHCLRNMPRHLCLTSLFKLKTMYLQEHKEMIHNPKNMLGHVILC
jgi:hypothetical protein